MKVKEKMRDQKQRSIYIQARPKKSTVIPRLVAGLAIAGLIAGVGYGVFFVSSLFSITTELSNLKSSPKQTEPIVQSHQVPQPVNTPPPQPQEPVKPKIVAAAEPAPVEPEITEQETEEIDDTEEPVAVDENGLIDDDSEAMAIAREIELLRAALPNNMMVPAEKTEGEVEALLADAEEQHALQKLIDKGTATLEDRERYFDLISNQYEDERELINYCKDLVNNGDERSGTPHTVCDQVAHDSEQRLLELDASLEELRQKIL